MSAKAKLDQVGDRLVKARARSLTAFKFPALKSLLVVVVGWGGLFDYSVYSWPRFRQGQLLRKRNLYVSSFEKFTGGGGGVGWGGLLDYCVYSWPRFCQGQLLKKKNLLVSSFEKFSGGGGGVGWVGLFDYSVYSWPGL